MWWLPRRTHTMLLLLLLVLAVRPGVGLVCLWLLVVCLMFGVMKRVGRTTALGGQLWLLKCCLPAQHAEMIEGSYARLY
jgi:hypothetical protein